MTDSAQSNGYLTEQLPSLKNAKIIFFIGAPGTGKGTQCTRLAEELGFVHISVGDLLRDREKYPSSSPLLKALIRSRAKYRTPLPNDFYVGLLRAELVKNMEHGKSQFLVDGFPRNIKQLWLLEQDSPQLKATLHFFCPLEISRLRVANRALTSGRYNDNAEVFEERHRKFLKEGVDVFFRRMSELECHEIETNRTSDDVYRSIRTIVKDAFSTTA